MRAPRALPAVKAPKRAVDPRLALALRVLLEGRHRGRAAGATWEQLRDELVAEGVEVGVVRRLQEAASYLRRVGTGGSKVPVGATSQHGVYVIIDELDRRFAVAERRKRFTAEAEEIAALDVALAEEITGFLARVFPERDAVEETLEETHEGPLSPGQRVVGEEEVHTQQHGAGRPASGTSGASQHTETLQRRGSGEGGPPTPPAAANIRAPLPRPIQLGLLGRVA